MAGWFWNAADVQMITKSYDGLLLAHGGGNFGLQAGSMRNHPLRQR